MTEALSLHPAAPADQDALLTEATQLRDSVAPGTAYDIILSKP